MLIAIAVPGSSAITLGSIRNERAPTQYTSAISAMPESHVVYASHLNQWRCSVSGSRRGPVRYF